MARFATVDDYLAAVPTARRSRLDELRTLVRALAPDAVEQILYDMPAYKLDGAFLVSFGWFKAHDSVFPASRVVLETVADAGPYARGRGTFQFPVSKPLPMETIRRIVEARIAEVAAEARRPATPG